MPLDIFVRFEPKPGKQGRLADELMLVPEPTRAEPGCVRIHLYESTREPLAYFIHSEWIDEEAFEEHAQVTPPDPAERVVPLLFGAASGGSCASKEHAHDLAAPRGFAGVPQSFGAARRGPCAFEIHAELPHTRRLIDATGDLLAHPLQAVRTKEIG